MELHDTMEYNFLSMPLRAKVNLVVQEESKKFKKMGAEEEINGGRIKPGGARRLKKGFTLLGSSI